jgi:hypothetical protein
MQFAKPFLRTAASALGRNISVARRGIGFE